MGGPLNVFSGVCYRNALSVKKADESIRIDVTATTLTSRDPKGSIDLLVLYYQSHKHLFERGVGEAPLPYLRFDQLERISLWDTDWL